MQVRHGCLCRTSHDATIHHTSPMTHQDQSVILDPSVKDAALSRINYFITTVQRGKQADVRAILKWFVDFASAELTAMSAKRLKETGEEYRAIQAEVMTIQEGPPSQEYLAAFQTTIREHLATLTKRGKLTLGPFLVDLSVSVLPGRTPALSSGEHFVPRWFQGPQQPPVPGEALTYVMGQCLRQCGDLVKRCEWCQKFFLQARRVHSSRREQKYCSDYHRTRASKKREADRQEAQRALRHKKKGAKSHGTKKR